MDYFVGFFLTLSLGWLTFPVLFYFQNLFKLPKPDLEKERIHIHHSTYGLIIVIVGIGLGLEGNLKWAFAMVGYGLGILFHHEVSEPGLNGWEKFVYINKKLKR